jgi:hypothetical protein
MLDQKNKNTMSRGVNKAAVKGKCPLITTHCCGEQRKGGLVTASVSFTLISSSTVDVAERRNSLSLPFTIGSIYASAWSHFQKEFRECGGNSMEKVERKWLTSLDFDQYESNRTKVFLFGMVFLS